MLASSWLHGTQGLMLSDCVLRAAMAPQTQPTLLAHRIQTGVATLPGGGPGVFTEMITPELDLEGRADCLLADWGVITS